MKLKDQIGNNLILDAFPKRIVCLVPSLTELLYDLGLDNEVVGITKFCFEPEKWFKTKNRVGGTKTIDVDKIRDLKPDLIIANKEENDQAAVESLTKDFNVYTSDIKKVPDAIRAIADIGRVTNKDFKAKTINKQILSDFDKLIEIDNKAKVRVAYFVWNEPKMVAGGDTFINSMLELAGFINVFKHLNRYPNVTEEDLKKAEPVLLLLPTEPFPFKIKHFEQFKKYVPNAKPILVQGDMFSWYGSRMLKFSAYIKKLKSTIQ